MNNNEFPTAMSRRQLFATGAGAAAVLAVAASPTYAAPAPAGDSILQVRNATLLITYAGVRFLIDPMLAEKGAYPGFPGSASSYLRNPLVALPLPVADLLDVDAVIVTHTHLDHWDDAAQRMVPKNVPLFAQNEADAKLITGQGFRNVRVLGTDTIVKGVRVSKTAAQHATDAMLATGFDPGPACGMVFSKLAHRTVYVAGDTVLIPAVLETIAKVKPDFIVLNAGYAQFVDAGPVLMGPKDVLKVHQAAPSAKLVASHMEAINHCVLAKQDLRSFADKQGFAEHLLIPDDGEHVRV